MVQSKETIEAILAQNMVGPEALLALYDEFRAGGPVSGPSHPQCRGKQPTIPTGKLRDKQISHSHTK